MKLGLRTRMAGMLLLGACGCTGGRGTPNVADVQSPRNASNVGDGGRAAPTAPVK